MVAIKPNDASGVLFTFSIRYNSIKPTKEIQSTAENSTFPPSITNSRVNATKMGYLAVEMLLQGKTNRIVCTKDGHFTDVAIDDGLEMERRIQDIEVEVLAAMTGV